MESSPLEPGGLPSTPSENLIYRGGRLIAHLSYRNVYLGGAGAWSASDRTKIDRALSAAMADPNLNNVMMQYFDNNPISSTLAGSLVLTGPALPQIFAVSDCVRYVRSLFLQGQLANLDLNHSVVNLLLPSGTYLTAADHASQRLHRSAEANETNRAAGIPSEEEADSLQGLGGYHGSVHLTSPGGAGTTIYYAVGVYSETLANGKENGIVAFAQPWKNVVATFYHELNEARTDPDIDDAIAHNDDSFCGWTSDPGPLSRDSLEVGDFPIFEADQQLAKVFKEVKLASGGTAPIQLMYSNAVNGPEGPIKSPHPPAVSHVGPLNV